jgi:hypothetical protein
MPAILLAYEGKVEMLKAIFGGGEPEKPRPSALDLRTFARTHNALRSAGRIKD